MIVIRRELPRSRRVGRCRLTSARHIVSARILRAAASLPKPQRSFRTVPSCGSTGRSGHLLGDRPDEPGEFTGHRHRRDLGGFAPANETPELAMQAILSLPGNVDHFRRTPSTPLGQLRAHRVLEPVAPGRFDRLMERMAARNETFSNEEEEADMRKARVRRRSR